LSENAVIEQARVAHRELAKGYAAKIASARFERRPEHAA
jgi:hypothetical protein